jgi:hypothetical protein
VVWPGHRATGIPHTEADAAGKTRAIRIETAISFHPMSIPRINAPTMKPK